ncbi:membrane-bound lytic murein transglycosylase MltF [Halomonas halocynthiae]|uniref:membrane-bound lytic murein transglycosylase MltF n=1 Tax=Halomonas halocynthiae TaxID=176290 RepID=UPI00040D1D2C|nr:membrane-bound lytic murein transglycosylase MltF [Halomonas halocynthiae]
MLSSLVTRFGRYRRGYLLLGTALLLTLLPVPPPATPDKGLAEILAREFLSVHTRNTPTTYYEGRQGPTGFEYDLVRRFANQLDVSLTLDTSQRIDGIIDAVRLNGDLGAATLPIDPTQNGVMFSQPIMPLQPVLVYRRGLPPPKTLDDLQRLQIGTLSGTGSNQAMYELQRNIPALSWKASDRIEVAELLAQVTNGSLDAAVVYEHEFRINRLFFPEVDQGFAIGKPLSLAWVVAKHNGHDLLLQINLFLDELKSSGELERLQTKYLGRDNYLEYVGARTFIDHMRGRLPTYKELFQEAAKNYGFDWKLLAAAGYQESHWQPDATSPTGVRGLMMLTLPTASDLGVENRLDPAQSIDGGARYLRDIKQRLPESITGIDRLYMALAAYNVGLGHLYDARNLTEERGGNPDLWADVSETLPLLQHREWFEKTRYGYARGEEPVIYVRNIRRYYEILTYVDRSQQQFHQLNERQPSSDDSLLFDVIPPNEQAADS